VRIRQELSIVQQIFTKNLPHVMYRAKTNLLVSEKRHGPYFCSVNSLEKDINKEIPLKHERYIRALNKYRQMKYSGTNVVFEMFSVCMYIVLTEMCF
jgi:hypothetical protein